MPRCTLRRSCRRTPRRGRHWWTWWSSPPPEGDLPPSGGSQSRDLGGGAHASLDRAVHVPLILDAGVLAGEHDPARRARQPRAPERIEARIEIGVPAARQGIVIPDDRLRRQQLSGFPEPLDAPEDA